jgi:hypothetical protein
MRVQCTHRLLWQIHFNKVLFDTSIETWRPGASLTSILTCLKIIWQHLRGSPPPQRPRGHACFVEFWNQKQQQCANCPCVIVWLEFLLHGYQFCWNCRHWMAFYWSSLLTAKCFTFLHQSNNSSDFIRYEPCTINSSLNFARKLSYIRSWMYFWGDILI